MTMGPEVYSGRPATPEEVRKETSLPFSREQIEAIAEQYPTPFFIYDEKGMRDNARTFRNAFSWAPGFTNYFAVKALPNPHILRIMMEEGFGADCSSAVELEMAKRVGIAPKKIMFTSNNTPADQFVQAREMDAVINLDDITHLEYMEEAVKEHGGLPETLCFRYNPGATRVGNEILGGPEEAKYGHRRDQLFKAIRMAKERGVKRFGLHTMIASNELNPEYFAETARMLFKLVGEINDELGVRIDLVNFGGGVGIDYRPSEKPVDIEAVSRQIRSDYQQLIAAKGLDPLQITFECGRFMAGPYGYFVARARHVTEKYRHFAGLEGSTTSMPRVAIYDKAYHHATVLGKEGGQREMIYDVTGALCESTDRWAKQREMPAIHPNDLVVIHDAGGHGIAMANEYNGQLIPGELLLRPDGSVLQIRRPRTMDDYFSTIVNFPGFND